MLFAIVASLRGGCPARYCYTGVMQDKQADKLVALISGDMRQALKARDAAVVGALRSLLARIHSAEAVAAPATVGDSAKIAGAQQGVGSTEVARRELTLADLQQVIAQELDEINETLRAIGPDTDYAAELRVKMAALRVYMDERRPSG